MDDLVKDAETAYNEAALEKRKNMALVCRAHSFRARKEGRRRCVHDPVEQKGKRT